MLCFQRTLTHFEAMCRDSTWMYFTVKCLINDSLLTATGSSAAAGCCSVRWEKKRCYDWTTWQGLCKVKPLYRLKWPMGLALNSGFISMKQLGVLLLPPGWDASPSQGYPQHICWYPFVHLGEEKHCESKVSCLRTQDNDPSQGSNLDHSICSRKH